MWDKNQIPESKSINQISYPYMGENIRLKLDII